MSQPANQEPATPTAPSKLLEIFRPGSFTSAEGLPIDFSAADVAATVAAYDTQKHRAPLVIGHPNLDDPAYGHAAKLSLSSSNVILAEPTNVDPAFADAVNAQRYDSISASFWSPTNPRNPVPGVFYLRHIGFLGAVPPAVAGLKTPSFAEADTDLITINFSDTHHFPANQKVEPNMTPEEKAVLAAQQKKLQDDQASFADQQKTLADKEAALAVKEKALADANEKIRSDGIASFAEGLVTAGKLLPAEKSSIVAVLAALPNEQTISFADGDGKTIQQSTADALRNFLTALPARVSFAEYSGTDKTQADTASFAAPNGYTVDTSQNELHNKITAHAKQHNMTYAQAAAAMD